METRKCRLRESLFPGVPPFHVFLPPDKQYDDPPCAGTLHVVQYCTCFKLYIERCTYLTLYLACIEFQVSLNSYQDKIIFILFHYTALYLNQLVDICIVVQVNNDFRYFSKRSGNFQRVFSLVTTSQMCNIPSSNFPSLY